MKRKSASDSSLATAIKCLRALQRELLKIDAEVLGTDGIVGHVRELLDQNNLPVLFYPNTLYKRRHLEHDPEIPFGDEFVTDSNAGSSSCDDLDLDEALAADKDDSEDSD